MLEIQILCMECGHDLINLEGSDLLYCVKCGRVFEVQGVRLWEVRKNSRELPIASREMTWLSRERR